MAAKLATAVAEDAKALAGETSSAVYVKNLNFAYDECSPNVLHDINLDIPRGSRVLLVGSNGAGKSTLLRVLGGLHSYSDDARVLILGRDSFNDTRLNMERIRMDPNWGLQTVAFAGAGMAYTCDMEVGSMMAFMQKEFPERRDRLAELLGINLKWSWTRLSDGQRRRVQLFLGLLVPYQVILLDEVTALLDLLCRNDLLRYLKEESETRGCTVIIATHVFDGLDNWATHAIWVRSFPVQGTVGFFGSVKDQAPEMQSTGGVLKTVEKWLRTEQQERIAAQKQKKEEQQEETEEGETAHYMKNPLTLATLSAGGYAPGRSAQITERSLNYDAVRATRGPLS